MSLIAVDLGTSFIKGAVLDLESLTIGHVTREAFPDPIPRLPPLWHEVDPHAVAAAVSNLIARLLPHAPDCQGILACTQMHGLVLTDARGASLSNAITWQDQRALLPHPAGAGAYFDVIAQRLEPAQQRQLGNELKPSLPLCALFCLAQEGRLSRQEAIPAPLADFVFANLSSSMPSSEATNAAAHGAFNLETHDWHYEVIARLGLERLRWPALRAIGEVAYHIPVGSTWLPCFTPVGDHQCALLGALLQEGELSLNISTGSQVSMIASRLVYGDYQIRPYFDGCFLNTNSRIPAGRALNHLVNLLTELARAQKVELRDPWQAIAHAVEATPVTDLQVDLSFFASLFGNRGAIANIHEDNLTVGHLFRAAFRQMAENYYTCASRISPDKAWRNLVFSGGLAQKLAVLRAIICGRFQSSYRMCPTSEDTLLGLMALGLFASGRAQSVDQATALLLGSSWGNSSEPEA